MKTPVRLIVAACVLTCLPAGAWIPPVRDMVEQVFAGRRATSGLVLTMNHRVQVPGGQTVAVEEKILVDGNQVLLIWRAGNQAMAAQWERQSYVVNPQAAMASRSSVFLKYLLGHTPEDFLRQLLGENFVGREQLVVFNAGYNPKGDPNTWKSSQFYRRHDDIFYTRVGSGMAVAVVGLEEGSVRKSVYFDDSFQGVSRVEWKEGGASTYWDFAGFQAQKGVGGRYPTRLTFAYQGVERVASTLNSVAVARVKDIAEFKRTFQSIRASGVNSSLEPVLKILLSYR